MKGCQDDWEEYSGFNGVNVHHQLLGELVRLHVYVCGIVTEYCVKETVLSLLKLGRKMTLLTDCLGYVNEQHHFRVLEELADKGVCMIRSVE